MEMAAASGVLLGASAGIRLGSSLPVTLRLGTGVLLGSLKDQRTGTFTTTAPIPMRLPRPTRTS